MTRPQPLNDSGVGRARPKRAASNRNLGALPPPTSESPLDAARGLFVGVVLGCLLWGAAIVVVRAISLVLQALK